MANSIHNRTSGFVVEKILNITLFALSICLILFTSRIVGLIYLIRNNLLNISNDFIGKSLLMGARYDAKFSIIIVSPIIIVFIFTAFFKKYRKTIFSIFSKLFVIIVGAIVIIIEMINYNYFKFFKNQLNVDVFGIFYDDTSALVSSIIADYPLFFNSIFFLIFLLLFSLLIFYILRIKIRSISILKSIFISALFLIISFYFARGSFSTFPLRQTDKSVSSNPLVNEFVMNSPTALIEAYKDLKRVDFELDIDKVLSNAGYSSFEECLSNYPFNVGDKVENLFYYKSSKKEQNFVQPNVVVIFMEGMGSVFFQPISKTDDYIGELKNQLNDCDFFLKAMPTGHITYSSMDGFLFSTITGPLSQSKFNSKKISSSVASPFKNAGYTTSFLTGGKLDWRNYGSFLKNQDFDFCQGMEIISEAYNSVESGEWGVYDEYLFNFLYDKLSSQDNPQFIFALTTTNHIPYTLPKDFEIKDYDISEFEDNLSIRGEQFKNNLSAFNYASHHLGVFLKRLSESEFADNTIVVITGDHNMRESFNYPKYWHHKNLAVPIIFRVPDLYKPNITDTSKWISHRDIRNTIFELALSEKEYFATGINIYDSIPDNYFAVRTYNTVFSDYGMFDLVNNLTYSSENNDWNSRYIISDTDSLNLMNSAKAYKTLVEIAQANILKK